MLFDFVRDVFQTVASNCPAMMKSNFTKIVCWLNIGNPAPKINITTLKRIMQNYISLWVFPNLEWDCYSDFFHIFSSMTLSAKPRATAQQVDQALRVDKPLTSTRSPSHRAFA